MSTATLERPKTLRVNAPGGLNKMVERTPGTTVNGYLKALGTEIPNDHVPVVGGMPVTGDAIVPDTAAAITVAYRPENG